MLCYAGLFRVRAPIRYTRASRCAAAARRGGGGGQPAVCGGVHQRRCAQRRLDETGPCEDGFTACINTCMSCRIVACPVGPDTPSGNIPVTAHDMKHATCYATCDATGRGFIAAAFASDSRGILSGRGGRHRHHGCAPRCVQSHGQATLHHLPGGLLPC